MRAAFHRGRDSRAIAYVAFHQFQPWMTRQVFRTTGGQVVEHDDFAVRLEQRLDGVGANEAGTAGDQNAHR